MYDRQTRLATVLLYQTSIIQILKLLNTYMYDVLWDKVEVEK